MTIAIPFDNSYARLPGGFHSVQAPTPVRAPRLVAFNTELAQLLGVTPGEAREMAQVFAGNADALAQIDAARARAGLPE